MSEDDNNKKLSENTAPEHNYKNVKNDTKGPKGTSGIRRTPSGLGLGTSTQTVRVYMDIEVSDAASNQEPDQTDAEKRASYLNSLPEDTVFTSETGDKDVDQQSAENGEVPVTEKELEALKSGKIEPELEGPQISQSDFAKSFRRAQAQTDSFQQDKDQEIE